MAPDYDHLTLMQKVEVFEHALSNTNGDDLAKLLWLKSPSSEVWEIMRNIGKPGTRANHVFKMWYHIGYHGLSHDMDNQL